MSLPLLLSFFAFLPQGVTNPVPFIDLKASYPYGEQTAFEVTPDHARGFTAPGGAITLLDLLPVTQGGEPRVIDRVELPECSPVRMRYFQHPATAARALFIAGGTSGLWRLALCPELFATPPVSCGSYPPTPIARVGMNQVWKRCVDVEVVTGNAAAGAPLLLALFAARTDAPVGPTELHAYKLLNDGSIVTYARLHFVDAISALPGAGTAIESDPANPNTLYVALGAAGIRRVNMSTSSFTSQALDMPPCPLTPCPAGEQVRDLAFVRPANGTASLFAALDYGRIAEYAIVAGTDPAPIVHPIPCGYPARISAATDGLHRIVVAVGVQRRPAIEVETSAPFVNTGIWTNICVRTGISDPNGFQPDGCEEVQLFERPLSAGNGPLGLLTTHPFGSAWGTLALRLIAGVTYRLYECTNTEGVAIRRLRYTRAPPFGQAAALGGPISFRFDLLATHIDRGFAAVDGVVSSLNPGLTYFGLDTVGNVEAEGGMLYIEPGNSPDIVPVPGTQALCPPTISRPPLAGCTDAPNPYSGNILGGAHWLDPLDAQREIFLPGTATWVRADEHCQRTNVECGSPCAASRPVYWIQDYLTSSGVDPSKLGWSFVSMVPGTGLPTRDSLQKKWWQIACPSVFDPFKSETIDYVHSAWRPELGDVVFGARGGSEYGFKVLRRSNLHVLAAQTCTPGGQGNGERLPPPPALQFLETRTHVEREIPGFDGQGNELDPCNVNALCAPTPTFVRNLFNNRIHTFPVQDPDGNQRMVAVVAAGYVATGPSTQFVQQPASCQWDDHYGKGLLVLYDVTGTIQSFLPPVLLRVALGPGPTAPVDPVEATFWSVDTKTYGNGAGARTLAFAADLLGRLFVFDVSGDQLYPAAGDPYLPDPSTGLAPTPILWPTATIVFPSDAVDLQAQSCVDVVVNRGHAYCAVGRAGVGIVDIASPSSPQLVLMLDTPGLALGVEVRTDEQGREQLLVGDSRCGVHLFGETGAVGTIVGAEGNMTSGRIRIVMTAAALLGAALLGIGGRAAGQCHSWADSFGGAQGLGNEPAVLLSFDDGSGSALFVGGLFGVPGTSHSNVGRWNGSSWAALGTGTDDAVLALAAFDAGGGAALFAGGSFTSAGGLAARGIARWNGSAWSALGTGVGGALATVYALHVHDDGTGAALYAGGSFLAISGTSSAHVARWNGTSWSALGSGTNERVLAFATFDGGAGPELVASGFFTQAGGAPVNGIARWNGTGWAALGTGQGGGAQALCVFDEGGGPRLFAAGGPEFLARWDGSSWTSVGGGLSNVVRDLVVYDDGSGPALHAGGSFLSAGGSPARHVARWDGASWSRLGAGLDNPLASEDVRGLAVHDGNLGGGADLYVVGTFTQSALLPARALAAWRGCTSPVDTFCFGDGSLLDCPCSNRGTSGRGCAWHADPAGALLSSSGSPTADNAALGALAMPATATSIFLKSDALLASGAPFGDGLLCLGGALLRLGTAINSAGTAQYPSGAQPSLSVRSQVAVGSGVVAYYQVWFRNAADFCTSATSNATNGVRVVW